MTRVLLKETLSGWKVVGTSSRALHPGRRRHSVLLLGALVNEGPGILDRVAQTHLGIRLSLDTWGRSLYISRERSTVVSWGPV
jgi:hypothetical protein